MCVDPHASRASSTLVVRQVAAGEGPLSESVQQAGGGRSGPMLGERSPQVRTYCGAKVARYHWPTSVPWTGRLYGV